MKNKKITYFLIPLVLGVWGLIGFRVYDTVSTPDDNPTAPAVKQEKELFNDFGTPRDTAKLALNYRDPFGLVPQKDTATKITRLTTVKELTLQPKPAMNWSFITYSGYVRNPSSKKLVALVTINGQNVTLAEGEVKNQVRLIKNLRDSIKISYAGKTKFITIRSAL